MRRSWILIPLLLTVFGCSSTPIIGEETANEKEEVAIPAAMMPYRPIAEQFANALANADVITSYNLFASFTKSNIPPNEWNESFMRYYEGFNKPSIPELTIDPWDGDREWATMRGAPQDFQLENIKAEAGVYLGHPEKPVGSEESEDDGFFVSFLIVEENGQLRIAGPYIED